MTSEECDEQDLKSCSLTKDAALERKAWKGLIVLNCPTRANC